MGNSVRKHQMEYEALDQMYDQYNRMMGKLFLLKNLLYTTNFDMRNSEIKMIITNVRSFTKQKFSAKNKKDCKKLKNNADKIIAQIDIMIEKVQLESEKQQPEWIVETLRRHKKS